MAVDTVLTNYYAVLQVRPDADAEIIEAVYRQLMKRYHPDLAGDDPLLVARHTERAKAINQAFSVLRDPEKRRLYDSTLRVNGTRPTADPTRWAAASGSNGGVAPSARPGATPTPPPPYSEEPANSVFSGPLALLSAAYFLLPGPYEWDANHHRELRTVFLVPPLGVASFLLATGRLAPWLGHSQNLTILAWVLLALLSLPAWSSLPRLALAAVPTLILLSGTLDALFRQVNLPSWLAGGLLGLLGLVLSARLYVFAVLPTLAICWLIGSLAK